MTPRNEAGFTLLEVLIAGVIAALALGVLFRVGIGGIEQSRIAGQTEEAVAIAQSHLAIAATDPVPGTARGRDGPYAWQSTIAPIATTTAATDLQAFVHQAGEMPATLYAIGVTVSWPGGHRTRQLTLQTRRLGFPHTGIPR